MSNYKYTRDELTLEITEAGSSHGYAAVGIEYRDSHKPPSRSPGRFCILVDPRERQAAAQALAGDRWGVLSADSIKTWRDHVVGHEPINVADVKIGDVVEIEGDNWLVRGPVTREVFQGEIQIEYCGGRRREINTSDAIVRLVRREPDSADVEALAKELEDAKPDTDYVWDSGDWLDYARELLRRGVTVGGAS